jgi:hypothetical protein
MCGRLWRVLHPLLTLFAVGCCVWLLCRDANQSPTALPTQPSVVSKAVAPAPFQDSSLRSLFGVGRIGGEYTVPSDDTRYTVKLLRFEDGVYLPNRQSSFSWLNSGESRTIQVYANWGRRSDGTMGVALEFGGNTLTMTDEFFAKLTGSMSIFGGAEEELRGYRIVGYVTTSRRRGGDDSGRFGAAPLAQLIQTQQCVVALGVKTFPTEEAAQAWTSRNEP